MDVAKTANVTRHSRSADVDCDDERDDDSEGEDQREGGEARHRLAHTGAVDDDVAGDSGECRCTDEDERAMVSEDCVSCHTGSTRNHKEGRFDTRRVLAFLRRDPPGPTDCGAHRVITAAVHPQFEGVVPLVREYICPPEAGL